MNSQKLVSKMNNRGVANPKTIILLVVSIVFVVSLLSTIFSPSIGLGNTTTGAPAWFITVMGVIVAGTLVYKYADF